MTITDTTGQVIKLHDVLIDSSTQEIALVVQGYNKSHEALAVSNSIIGINDWLSVYPDRHWTILGNAAVSADN